MNNNEEYNSAETSSDESFLECDLFSAKEIAMRKIQFALADFEEQRSKNQKTLILRTSHDVAHHQIRYTKNSQQKMERDLKCLHQVLDLLQNDKKSTKRELFYEFKGLYQCQRNLDASITAICELLDEKRGNLNVTASGRGFLRGAVTFLTENVGIVDARVQTVLVQDSLCHSGLISEAQFVLVVEKDTIFQKLLDENFQSIFPRGILITARGYPDIATRNVVRFIADKNNLPVFGLFDADPHGIEIYLTYKYGKVEQKAEARGAVVPSIQWIGVYPSDVSHFPICPSQRLPLSNRDVLKMRKLICRSMQLAEHRVTRELDGMLQMKCKLEIEAIVMCGNQFLSRYVIAPRITVEKDDAMIGGFRVESDGKTDGFSLKWSDGPRGIHEDYNSDASDDEVIAEILEEVNGYPHCFL